MAVYKEEKTGTWRAVYRYTDWNGERKQTQKRGFKTKREAQTWEREQVHKTSADLDMNFKSFVELYTADMKTRLKENTWATKEHIIRTKLLPYFGKLKMCNITAQQIITWQNEMLNHKEEKTGTWRAVYRYTDWNGERKQTQKRGFKTKREAQTWEREQVHKTSADLDMNFKSFVELYTADMKTRLKENTWATKEHIIRTKLLPYFGKLKMCNITAQQIITWQNEMLNHKDEKGQSYSPVYLKTVHNQLSAIFNHAVRYYNLRDNPCKKAGSMGKKKNREMMFWTKEQYLKFAEVMMDKPLSFYAFEMLYWCGIREGELLALTPADFDFEKRTVTINKSYQRLNGQDLITTPKTEKSNRVITMPQFLAEEIQDYLKMLYGIGADDRMFTVTKSYLHREMDRGSKEAGVPRIRIHDIRHSAVSLLIDMGFSATAIADRVGHESIDITYNYAHLFPSKQTEMADKLNMERGN